MHMPYEYYLIIDLNTVRIEVEMLLNDSIGSNSYIATLNYMADTA